MAKLTPKKTTKSKPKSSSPLSSAKAAPPSKGDGRSGRKACAPPTKPLAKRLAKPVQPVKQAKAPATVAAKAKAKVVAVSARPAALPANNHGKPTPSTVVPVQAPLKSVASGAKLNKNQAGLKAKDLEYFRVLLLAKRRELLGDVHSMEEEALRSGSGTNLSNLPIHMADMGTDNYEQEFTLGLVQKDRDLLQEINIALSKLRDGTFGICEGTGKPISRPRLEAKPWAKYSIEYARKLEKSRMHG